MSPKCQLIINKTRELLDATPPGTLAIVYTTQLREGIRALESAPEGGWLRQKIPYFSALLEHVGKLDTSDVAQEFRNFVEGIISTNDERIIMDTCKHATMGIAEVEQRGGMS